MSQKKMARKDCGFGSADANQPRGQAQFQRSPPPRRTAHISRSSQSITSTWTSHTDIVHPGTVKIILSSLRVHLLSHMCLRIGIVAAQRSHFFKVNQLLDNSISYFRRPRVSGNVLRSRATLDELVLQLQRGELGIKVSVMTSLHSRLIASTSTFALSRLHNVSSPLLTSSCDNMLYPMNHERLCMYIMHSKLKMMHSTVYATARDSTPWMFSLHTYIHEKHTRPVVLLLRLH